MKYNFKEVNLMAKKNYKSTSKKKTHTHKQHTVPDIIYNYSFKFKSKR
jgi:hypothetical protein